MWIKRYPHRILRTWTSEIIAGPTYGGESVSAAPAFIPSRFADKKGQIADEKRYPTENAHISAMLVPMYYIRRPIKIICSPRFA